MRASHLVMSVFSLVALLACNTKPAPSTQSADSIVTKQRATADSTVISVPADSLAAHIAELLRTSLVKDDIANLTDRDRDFVYSQADLNGDGQQELFVAMKGSYFCGNAGCTVFLLDKDFKKISTFTIVSGPILISDIKTRGWYGLIVPSRGRYYSVTFDGKKYPGNPSVQPEFRKEMPATAITVLPADAKVHQF